MKIKDKGFLILALGSLLSSVPYIATHYVFQNFPDLNVVNISAQSFLITSMLVTPFFLGSKQKHQRIKTEWNLHKKLLRNIILITSLGALLWVYSLKFGSAGLISFLKKTDILFTLIIGQIFLKEKISKQEVFGAIIAIIGFITMSDADQSNTSLLAIGAIILAQAFYAMQSFLVKKHPQKIDPFIFSWIRLFGLGAVFLLIAIISQQLAFVPNKALFIFVVGQIFGGFLYRVAYFKAHQYLDISKISIFLLINPVLTVTISTLLLNENINTQKIIGILVILTGLIIFVRTKKKESSLKK